MKTLLIGILAFSTIAAHANCSSKNIKNAFNEYLNASNNVSGNAWIGWDGLYRVARQAYRVAAANQNLTGIIATSADVQRGLAEMNRKEKELEVVREYINDTSVKGEKFKELLDTCLK